MRRMLALSLAVMLLLCGCGDLQSAIEQRLAEPTDTALFAMDTAMNLRLYGDDDGTVAAELTALLQELDAALSVTNPESAVYALNHSGRSEDERIMALFSLARELCERTGGAADPTVFPAVQLWGFTGEAYRVPSPDEIAEVRGYIGLQHVHTDGGRLRLDPGSALDFGAFAKGWAGDLCRELLEQRDMPAILTLGGNIQTVGSKPDGSPWSIGVADPDAPSSYCLRLDVTGTKAVVTSGDYQRGFEYEGVRYCHIFDPATGCPVSNGLRSVTVICDSGVTADGLSTALFVMGQEKAVEFWRNSSDFEAILIDAEGSIFVTAGLEGLVSECEYTVIAR